MEIQSSIIRQRIGRLCQERGISLAEVERSCGFASGSISHWETKVPSVERVGRVADFFGVSVDYLIGRSASVTDVSGVSGAYLSIARDAQELGIAPEDLELILQAVRNMRGQSKSE